MNKNKFRFWNPPTKAFVENYKYNGLVDELFEQDDMLIPTQFTGMCDKNGKELYEGDIIKFSWHPKQSEKMSQIKFKAGSFYAEILFPSGTLNTVWLPELFSGGLIKNDFEILGNIFQNPELLEI